MCLKHVATKKFEAHRTLDTPKPKGYGLFVRIRLEHVWLTLHDLGLKPKTVFCMCCGRGKEVQFFLSLKKEVTGLDISRDRLKDCKWKYSENSSLLNVTVGDAETLPFTENSFDLALVVMGLHHLPHPYQGLRELSRVSKNALALAEIVEPLITKLLKHLALFKTECCGAKPNRLNLMEINNVLLSQGLTVEKTIHQFGYLPGFFGSIMSYRLEKALFKLQQTVLRFIPSLSKVLCNEVVIIAHKPS